MMHMQVTPTKLHTHCCSCSRNTDPLFRSLADISRFFTIMTVLAQYRLLKIRTLQLNELRLTFNAGMIILASVALMSLEKFG